VRIEITIFQSETSLTDIAYQSASAAMSDAGTALYVFSGHFRPMTNEDHAL